MTLRTDDRYARTPKPHAEWLSAYWLNRAAEQRAAARRWPDMRVMCIAGARGMVQHARDARAMQRRLPQ